MVPAPPSPVSIHWHCGLWCESGGTFYGAAGLRCAGPSSRRRSPLSAAGALSVGSVSGERLSWKKKPDAPELEKHHFDMFMFSELDNLEYILEKHRQRYVHRDLVSRAIQHFWQRCKDREIGQVFCSRVQGWFGSDGKSQFAGYREDTRIAAHFLADYAKGHP